MIPECMHNKHWTPSGWRWRCFKIQIGWRPSTVETHKNIPMVTFMSPMIWIPREVSYASCLLAMTKINNINATESRVGQCDGTCHSDDLARSRVDETRDEFSHDLEAATRRIGPNTAQVLQEDSQRQGCERQAVMVKKWQSTEILMPFLVLRERYLRDDIACGIIGLCDSPNPTLPARGDLSHANFPNGHFLLPDTNVFLHQVCPLNTRNLFMA